MAINLEQERIETAEITASVALLQPSRAIDSIIARAELLLGKGNELRSTHWDDGTGDWQNWGGYSEWSGDQWNDH